MHGYEMIKEIEERTEGAWTPSAGSIYPTLQMLEDEGLIQRRGERRQAPLHPHRGRHRRADGEGRARRPRGTRSAPAPLPSRSTCATRSSKLHHSIGQVFHAADEGQQKRVRELLDETRRKIYAILAEEG